MNSAASQAILGNETVAKAFQSPLDGIVDAVADAINAGMLMPEPHIPFGIRDSEGEPLSSACAAVCDPGTGVQGDSTNASASSRPKCTQCPAGSYSMGGKAAQCSLCQPGSPWSSSGRVRGVK